MNQKIGFDNYIEEKKEELAQLEYKRRTMEMEGVDTIEIDSRIKELKEILKMW